MAALVAGFGCVTDKIGRLTPAFQQCAFLANRSASDTARRLFPGSYEPRTSSGPRASYRRTRRSGFHATHWVEREVGRFAGREEERVRGLTSRRGGGG